MIYRFSNPINSTPIGLFTTIKDAPKIVLVKAKEAFAFETIINKSSNGA